MIKDQQERRESIGSSGYFVRVLLVLVLLMQVLIVWGLFRKPVDIAERKVSDSEIGQEALTDEAGIGKKFRVVHSPWRFSRRDPFEDMDAMMTDAFRGMVRLGADINIDDGWDSLLASPALDMRDTDSDYIVSISIPGVDMDDVKVSLDGRVLSVKALTPASEANHSIVRSYERHILLPGSVGASSKMCANITNGVLRVKVPKGGKTDQRHMSGSLF